MTRPILDYLIRMDKGKRKITTTYEPWPKTYDEQWDFMDELARNLDDIYFKELDAEAGVYHIGLALYNNTAPHLPRDLRHEVEDDLEGIYWELVLANHDASNARREKDFETAKMRIHCFRQRISCAIRMVDEIIERHEGWPRITNNITDRNGGRVT